jgi:uncharacterized protein with ATP-grasp and redox domains
VDNAGADFVLGILPLACALARGGNRVSLGVNSRPSSNDMTAKEAEEILIRLRGIEELDALRARRRLTIVETGTGTPGIDLAHVGEDLNRAARGIDLLVLEGQGRAVETNWSTRFEVPAARLAVVKDPVVARAIGRDLMAPLIETTPPRGRPEPSGGPD